MNITRDELVETYRNMGTEELLDHWESGTLTELATEVATAEFARRGIALPNADTVSADADETALEETDFETVARSYTPTDMHILRGRLEADGIRAFVIDDNINQTNSLLAVATGGVRLQVARSQAPEALRIIAEVKAGERVLDDSPATDTASDLATATTSPELVPDAKALEWEVWVTAIVFLFGLIEFVKTMWLVRTYASDIEWDHVSFFATLLPILYFVAALLLLARSKWSLWCFCGHLLCSIVVIVFMATDHPIQADEVVGWCTTGAVIYFCVHLRRRHRLA